MRAVQDVIPGRLLVATPATVDPNFARTVVLVLEHSPGGSLGVVLNRPTDLSVAETLPAWSAVMSPPGLVFEGGPVEAQAAICLGRRRPDTEPDAIAGWRPVSDRVGTVDLDGDPDYLGAHMDAVRLFAGYAGWAPGQLDGEIDAGGWFVLGADDEDAFASDAEELWRVVLKRQSGPIAWVANFPADPALN